MADEHTQALDDTSWWAFEGPADGPAPTLSFDEPLEWPEVDIDNDHLTGRDDRVAGTDDGGPPTEAVAFTPGALEFSDADGDLHFPPVSDPSAILEPERAARPEASAAGADPRLSLDSLPESIWTADPPTEDRSVDAWRAAAAGAGGIGTLGAGTLATDAAAAAGAGSTVYAGTEPADAGRRFRFDFRPGQNAAVVALISFVSVVLVLMFLSVRARNDVPTERNPQTPVGEIAANRPVNTVPPLTTTVPSTPPSTVALSELLPASEDGPTASVPAPAAGGSGGAAPRAFTATTAPRSSAAPSGGGGGGGGGSSPQTTTATTAPAPEPEPEPPVSEPTPPPSIGDTGSTTNNTVRPRTTVTTTPDLTVPTVTFPGTSPTTAPPYTWPTFPPT